MSISVNNSAVIASSWTTFKSNAITNKVLVVQYDDDGTVYTIFAFDDHIAYSCTIWKGTVPSQIIANGYSQAQNDSDKSDFETNFKPTANGYTAPAVKQPSTAASVTDPAMVVAISPNNTISTAFISDRIVTGNISALNGFVAINTQGVSNVGIEITGIWSAILVFQGTIDGSTWFNLQGLPNPVMSTSTTTSSVATNGQYTVPSAGLNQLRVFCNFYSSGIAAVNLEGSAASSITTGIVTVQQGASAPASGAWPVELTDGTSLLGIPAHPVRTDPTGTTTQPISGSVTQGTAAALAGAWPVELTDGTNVLGTSSHPVRTDPTGTTTQPISGSVTQGTAAAIAGAWPVKLTDGTNTGVLKAANTAVVAGDTSLSVGLSPNSALPNLRSVDSGNSSTATMSASGSFFGVGTSALNIESISVVAMAIGATAPPGTLTVEQSTDNSNWDIQDAFSVTGGTSSPNGVFNVIVNLRAQYYRIVYNNGATAQTAFRMQTIQIPVSNALPDVSTQKGTQAPMFLPVQNAKDSGRTAKIFTASATTSTTSDTIITLTPYSNFTAGSTGTSFQPTAGKTFRIQTINCTIRATTTTVISAANFRFRVSASGAVTTSTEVAATILLPATVAVANAGTNGSINFPDGLELSGTMQFGISMLASSTSSTFDVQIIGYEY